MNDPAIMQLFTDAGAVVTDSHFVYSSGRHSSVYINKDALYLHTDTISRLCELMVRPYDADQIDVVVGPVLGGIVLSQWAAHHLNLRRSRGETLAVYAEKESLEIPPANAASDPGIPNDNAAVASSCAQSFGKEASSSAQAGGKEADEIDKKFFFSRGYDRYIAGKNILVVEDVLTTGGSVRRVIELIHRYGGNVVGLSALCNRGNVQPTDVGGAPIESVIAIKLETFTEAECPFCQQQVPINTELGKGRAFLAKKIDG